MDTSRFLTKDEFLAAVIAQDDDNDYQESGWLACVFADGTAAIGSYSHNSCYGTFEALIDSDDLNYHDDGTASFVWSGTVAQLVTMAANLADPVFPDRVAASDDHDYDHLVNMYRGVLAWAAARGVTPQPAVPYVVQTARRPRFRGRPST
jgi:hypothetical protein